MSSKNQKIIQILLSGKVSMQSSQIHAEMIKLGEDTSLVTVKRALSEMTNTGFLISKGVGRSTNYEVSLKGKIFADIDARQYVAIEPDKRYGSKSYNFDLLKALSDNIFADKEIKTLDNSTLTYKKRIKNLPPTIKKKELERLIIELSWKSSKIEGNTYTLLDTEKLILENKKAPGKSNEDAQMILNHKDAFKYIYQNQKRFKTMTKSNLEELHSILVKDLNVGLGLRTKPVGVIGSIYQPLDNIHQITEAIENLEKTISKNDTAYAKALVALLGISYIQPFEDGNKRTSRLMANALLLANNLAPLSYRSVDEDDYRSAMLLFYEINSIIPIKKIFIEQYAFAAENYTIS